MEPQLVSLGRKAFDAYAEAKAGLTHDSKPIPPWDALGDDIRAAWMAAVAAVRPDLDGTFVEDVIASRDVGLATLAMISQAVAMALGPLFRLRKIVAEGEHDVARNLLRGLARKLNTLDDLVRTHALAIGKSLAGPTPDDIDQRVAGDAAAPMWTCGVPGCGVKYGPIGVDDNPPPTCPDHQPPAAADGSIPKVAGPFRSVDERDGYWRGFDVGVIECVHRVSTLLGKGVARDRVLEFVIGTGSVTVYERDLPPRDPPDPTTREEAIAVMRDLLLLHIDAEDLEPPEARDLHSPQTCHARIVEIVNDRIHPEAFLSHDLGQHLSVVCTCGGTWKVYSRGAGRLRGYQVRQVRAACRLLCRQPENVPAVAT